MSENYTPGPWIIQDLGVKTGYPDWHIYAIRDEKNNVNLAVIGNVDRYFEKNNKANARLISAAPDLLEACKSIMEAEPMQGGERNGAIMGLISLAIDKARKAISKAEQGA